VPDDDFAKDAIALSTPGLVLPKVRTSVHPKYTSNAMRAKIQGQVIAQVIVEPDGTVSKTRVVRGLHSELDEEALIAARHWVFEPGSLDGRAVPVALLIVLEFRLH